MSVAVAKRALQAGETLDGEGGYTVWGKLVPAERSLAEGALPIGLAHHGAADARHRCGRDRALGRRRGPGQRGRARRGGTWSGVSRCRRPPSRRNEGGAHGIPAIRANRPESFRSSASAAGRSAALTAASTRANSERSVAQAIDSGITCFDTAEAYGMGVSEEALARALGGRRNDVVIATKFGVGYEEMPNRRDSSRGRVLASIDNSLRRLRTDHVDIYLVHWPDPNTPLDETMGALDDIVRQGKARYIGVSNFRLAQVEECMRLRRIDVVQYAWNMFDRRMQTEIFPYCAAQQIGVMAYGSLAYGMLSGTFHRRNVIRRKRLALARRHARQSEPVPNPVRP